MPRDDRTPSRRWATHTRVRTSEDPSLCAAARCSPCPGHRTRHRRGASTRCAPRTPREHAEDLPRRCGRTPAGRCAFGCYRTTLTPQGLIRPIRQGAAEVQHPDALHADRGEPRQHEPGRASPQARGELLAAHLDLHLAGDCEAGCLHGDLYDGLGGVDMNTLGRLGHPHPRCHFDHLHRHRIGGCRHVRVTEVVDLDVGGTDSVERADARDRRRAGGQACPTLPRHRLPRPRRRPWG